MTVESCVYIALLRGINVVGRNLLPMKELVRIMNRSGYADIRTYIQSGNVVFSCARKLCPNDAGRISDAIEDEFGFRPDVLLLHQGELERAIERNPFDAAEGKFLHFFFLRDEPLEPDVETLDALKSETEQFKLDGRVFYLFTPDGFARSKLAEKVERCLGVSATGRNLNTVRKLAEMAGLSIS